MADPTFTRRLVPVLGRPVFRLGLACNYGIDAPGFERALERGMDYVFWTSRRTGHLLRRQRASRTERLLRSLGTDYIDALAKLKAEGKIRAIGAENHPDWDSVRAGGTRVLR